jgi:hypothetical protein
MKKQLSLAAAVLFTAGAIFMTGCKKDDTTPPTITLKGNNPMTVSLNSSAPADPGATANDDKDGDISSSVTSDWSSTNPNVNVAGAYTITYSVSDAAGNNTTETRTVNVVNDAASWAGTYLKANIIDSTFGDAQHTNFTGLYTWTHDLVITASTTVNNQLIIDPFLDYINIAASEKIKGTVAGTALTIGSQTAHGIGSNNHDHTFQGAGSVLATTPMLKLRLVTSDHDINANADAFDSWTVSK